ncbi:MAG: hypothetical protein ABUK08_04360, partial [Candidatus Humimicrobiaceae bacterium]
MPLFRRKKITRPKNPLGMALYQYDKIVGKELAGLLKSLAAGKSLSPGRADSILESSVYKLNYILEDLSKENLKIDYQSDKARYMIVDMINDLKKYFERAGEKGFNGEFLLNDNTIKNPEEIKELREALKKKMKDIESDYI